MPLLPDYSPIEQQDLANIQFLLSPPTNYYEQDQATAQAAVRAGLGTGAGYRIPVGTQLRESERIRRMELGNKMLQPYQERQQAIDLAHIAQDAETFRTVLSGQQAMERLQLSESGETARLNQSIKSDLEKQAIAGKQAMEQLTLKGQQDTALALLNHSADLQRQILDSAEAMKRLQFSESETTKRATSEQESAWKRQVLVGQQNLEQQNNSIEAQKNLTGMQTAASMQELIVKGEQAKQLQALEQSGKMQQLTSQEKAAQQQQILQGEQAMAQIKAQYGYTAALQAQKEAHDVAMSNLTAQQQKAIQEIQGSQRLTEIQSQSNARMNELLAQQGYNWNRDVLNANLQTNLAGQRSALETNLAGQRAAAQNPQLSPGVNQMLSDVLNRYGQRVRSGQSTGSYPSTTRTSQGAIVPSSGGTSSGTWYPAYGGYTQDASQFDPLAAGFLPQSYDSGPPAPAYGNQTGWANPSAAPASQEYVNQWMQQNAPDAFYSDMIPYEEDTSMYFGG